MYFLNDKKFYIFIFFINNNYSSFSFSFSDNLKVIKLFYQKSDFIFEYLFKEFESIVNFISSSECQKMSEKLEQNEKKIISIITFFSTMLDFKKNNENVVNNYIIKYNENLIEQIKTLIYLLLKKGKVFS